MKKVWKYIILSLLLLLGLGCVGILYLFFVPNSSLFGITYINNKTTKEIKHAALSVNEIVLNSRAYDVKIVSTKDEMIHVKAYSNSFGFVLVENNIFDIKAEMLRSVLTINVTEPYGFAAKNESYIELQIPAEKEISITLNNLKADTLIEDEKVYIKDLKYKTTNGDFEFKKGEVNGNMNFNLNKATCKIYKEVKTTEYTEVDLRLTKGKFSASEVILGDVNIRSNERGTIVLGECWNLRENQKDSGGSITATKIAHANITAGDTNINITEISYSAIINLKASGNLTIEKIYGDSSLSTNTGNIYVGQSTSTISLYSESGNINLPKAYLSVVVKVGYGEAKIKFAEDAPLNSENSSARELHAVVKNGKLTATGVHKIGTATNENSEIVDGGIRITGNGRVFLTMDDVQGKNTINTNNGSAHVIINKSSIYSLKTSSQGGKIRVNLAQIPEYNGYTSKEERIIAVNGGNNINKSITATVKQGALTILDTNFA